MLTPVNMIKATGHGLLDGIKWLCGLSPHTVPIVATPERFAAMNSSESYPGYMAIVPEDTTWKNEVPARIALIVSFYSPMRAARKVRCPVLIVAAKGDSLVPVKAVRKTARRIVDCEFEELDCNHFAPYFGKWFEKNIELQTEFLKQHLFH
jgi:pimeloyl-ACP methyl ester carboxylesterase